MKRFFWMVLILTFLFSLTALYAQDKAAANKQEGKTEGAVEKVGKKVSEMPKVKVKQNRVVSSSEKQDINVSAKKPAPVLNKKPKALPVNKNKSN
jgi:hypothetical protein